MDEFITTTEAAVRLGISSARVRQMVLSGELPAQKLGPVNMVKACDLELVRNRRSVGRPKKEGAAENAQAEAVSTSAPTKKPPVTMTPAKKRDIAAEQRERWLAGAPGKKSPVGKAQVMKRGGKKY